MNAADVTIIEFKARIQKICARNPGKVNPRSDNGSTCLYTHKDDPTWHCIIGQYIADYHGEDAVPEDDPVTNAEVVMRNLGYSNEVARLAQNYQVAADNLKGLDGIAATWREVWVTVS